MLVLGLLVNSGSALFALCSLLPADDFSHPVYTVPVSLWTLALYKGLVTDSIQYTFNIMSVCSSTVCRGDNDDFNSLRLFKRCKAETKCSM